MLLGARERPRRRAGPPRAGRASRSPAAPTGPRARAARRGRARPGAPRSPRAAARPAPGRPASGTSTSASRSSPAPIASSPTRRASRAASASASAATSDVAGGSPTGWRRARDGAGATAGATAARSGPAAPARRRRGHERRDGARQRPAGRGGGGEHRLLVGGRVLREQPHEPPPQPLALARGGRLLLRVALRRLGRELVDVGEDRLAERVDGVGLEPAVAARLHEPPPRQPRAEPVGGQQRVEAAPRAHLAAAEVHVGRAPAAVVAGRVLDQVDEAPERALDAEPHDAPELALHRPRVVGHLDGDRADHLVGQPGQDGTQHRGGVGGDRREGSGGRRHYHEATRSSAISPWTRQVCPRLYGQHASMTVRPKQAPKRTADAGARSGF